MFFLLLNILTQFHKLTYDMNNRNELINNLEENQNIIILSYRYFTKYKPQGNEEKIKYILSVNDLYCKFYDKYISNTKNEIQFKDTVNMKEIIGDLNKLNQGGSMFITEGEKFIE